jgi:magnesium transporter
MANYALSELLGAPVLDPSGAVAGRVREIALTPQESRNEVFSVIVKTSSGDRILSREALQNVNGGIRSNKAADSWPEFSSPEGMLLLSRDLLDQQIIDVHGRKVVRVNDVDFEVIQNDGRVALRIFGVDVGTRGAVRRLLKGVVPMIALRGLLARIPPRIIPWEYVDLIETDPARRVKLRIESSGLNKLHPADIAEIVANLAPAEREAVFESLDEDVAAGALEEVDQKLGVSIVQSLDPEYAADIVEEMNPDAAADLLADLPDEKSEQILEEMEAEDRQDGEDLLEFSENTAAGRMTTDFLGFSEDATVLDAIDALRGFSGGPEAVSTLFVLDGEDKLVGMVPLASIVLVEQETPLKSLITEPLVSCRMDAKEREVAELFDKYNLLMMPVVDENGVVHGVITADDVIGLLREML